MMDVSIIYVNYRTKDLLINSIHSLIEMTIDVKYEIIVVDNNSGDESELALRKIFKDKVHFIQLTQNIGFAGANNKGMEVAIGRNLFLLNPDTILKNNSVKILSDFLDRTIDAGVAGANLYNEDYTPQASFTFLYPSISLELSNLFHLLFLFNRTSINLTESIIKVKSVVGAAMMVKREVIQKVGAFNPQFFMYAEENEWCHRIQKHGYYIYNIPSARIIHLDGKSFEFSEVRLQRRLEGTRTLYRVTYSPFYCKMLRLVEKVTISSRLVFARIFRNREKEVFWTFMYKNRNWK